MPRWPALILASLPLTAMAQTPITPGEWQETIHVQMPGSNMAMPAHTVKQCVKPQAASSVKAYLQRAQQPTCHMDEYKAQGDQYHWKMRCNGKVTTTTEGDFTLQNPKAYTIHMSTTMKTAAGDFTTKVTTNAKWLGACQ